MKNHFMMLTATLMCDWSRTASGHGAYLLYFC